MKHTLVSILMPASLITVALLSVGLSIAIAYRVALHEQQARTAIIASEMLHREQAISDQIAYARGVLEHSSSAPCSPAKIAILRNLALSSSYWQWVGYVEGNRLICSSYGDHGDGIPVGPADYLSSRGAWIRRSVLLPLLPDTRFFMVTESASGYSSLALPDLVLDTASESREISIALVTISNRHLIFGRGSIDVGQLPMFHRELGEMQWVNGEQTGTIRFARSNDYAAVAAVPVSVVRQAWLSIARFAAPLGAAIGTLIAMLLLALQRQRIGMLAQLDRAIRRKEFSLEYMPIVELSSGRWVGAEALLRWRRPGGQVVANPDQFIPIAEQYQRMKQLTVAMLDILVSDAQENLARRAGQLYVSINLSAQDLADTEIVEKLRLMREKSGLPNLLVEATEGGLLNVNRANRVIDQLRKLDIAVAIDDFGTGYSSLSYLGTLKVAYLKIDKSFVSAIGSGAVTRPVIDHIIAMAGDCNLMLIAEGVETEEQADYLRNAGVQYAQGWLFGRSMTAGELVIRGWRNTPANQVA